MKIEEIRERTDEELKTLSGQLQEDLFRLRVQKATNQLENTDSIRLARRDIAKVETVRRARQLGHEKSIRDKSK